MARKIFINYRWDDSGQTAGRLRDRLAAVFGKDHVFMDVENIPPDVDFVEFLKTKIPSYDVFLVLIGRDWLLVQDEAGRRRIENPDDSVIMEISTALEHKIRVIPVILDGARMPKAEELPAPIKSLARRIAVDLRSAHFHSDVDSLVSKIGRRTWRVWEIAVAVILIGGIVAFVTERLLNPRRDAERAQYNAARGNADKLRQYVADCSVCEFQDSARQEIDQLQAAQGRRDVERAQYNTARGNADKLRQYVANCSICEFRDSARQEIEDLLFRTALTCLQQLSSCNPASCLTEYRSIGASTGSHLKTLEDEARKITQSLRCQKLTYAGYENQDMEGGDLGEPIKNIDEKGCSTACGNKQPECIGYTYDKWSRWCLLKRQLTYLRSDPGYMTALRSDIQRPKQSAKEKKVEPRPLIYTGNIYRSNSLKSRDACAESCNKDARCLGYTYRSGRCELFDRLDFAIKDPAAQSGVKRQPAP